MSLSLIVLSLAIRGTLFVMSQEVWLPTIILLVYVGGVLVLFIYASSIAQNHSLSPRLTVLRVAPVLAALDVSYHPVYTNLSGSKPIVGSLSEVYLSSLGRVAVLLVRYLLVGLLVVCKIVRFHSGCLRSV